MVETNDKSEVLLVDDNSSEIELILRILKKNKLAERVFTFKDGIGALQYIYSKLDEHSGGGNLPKVIFLDLKMPRIDGLDVLRKIKSDERIKHIPVVILTSSHEESIMKECYKAGANSYIIKPVEYNSFVEYITKTILYWVYWNQSPF